MRSVFASLVLCLVALPAAAQQQHQAHHGAGQFPLGWHGRVDRANQNLADVQFTPMGSSFYLTTGPDIILWNPANTGTGSYRASVLFVQQTSPERLEGYGLLVGGRDLDRPTQDYLYFLIRHDGHYMIRHRAADEVHTLVDWTASEAIHTPSTMNAVTNELAIEALPQRVRFLVNGREVYAIDRVPMLNTEGIAGVRVGRQLDVNVSSFGIQPIAK